MKGWNRELGREGRKKVEMHKLKRRKHDGTCCPTHWVCVDDGGNAVVVQVSLSSHHPLHTDDT